MKEIAIIGGHCGLAVSLSRMLREHIKGIEYSFLWTAPEEFIIPRDQFTLCAHPNERKVKAFRPMNKTKKVFKQSMNRGK